MRFLPLVVSLIGHKLRLVWRWKIRNILIWGEIREVAIGDADSITEGSVISSINRRENIKYLFFNYKTKKQAVMRVSKGIKITWLFSPVVQF